MAPSSICEYYTGKNIFITGATGFIGKVLVEKLLRCCPGIEKIYLLMRPKKGQTSKERLHDFTANKVFEHIHNECPERMKKLRVVPGDILLEGLGISEEDREELQWQCHIIFNSAACVRFDMYIRDAMNMNTVGCSRTLALAEGMKQLEVFLHVSTAYSRCDIEVFEEKIYPSQHRPQDIMYCIEWMDDNLLKHMEPKLIYPHPNTYGYTKSLSEDLVSQYAGKFPIAIARPSIVTASYKEPFPGWVDNLNGPTGLLVGAGKGVIRTMHCNGENQADIIPVDMAVNGCIILAYTTALDKYKLKEVQVCNLTQSNKNPIKWREAIDMGRAHVKDCPFSVCLWYPGGSTKKSYLWHQIALFFTHFLPALLIDFLLLLLGKKTFMIQVQKKISYGLNVLQYYATKEWHFTNGNYLALRNKINKEDNETFYTDIEVIDWSTYVKHYMIGARHYCLKEDPSTLPQARKLIKRLYYLDVTVKVIFFALFVYFIYCYTSHLFI